jgi:hypothetical protein
MSSGIRDDFLVFSTGQGEWYNQPHDKIWDMGEDAADIPPPLWHLKLLRVANKSGLDVRHIVVDTTEMQWIVGQDWGFLVKLSEALASRGIPLSVVARANNVNSGKVVGIDRWFELVGSLDEALHHR